MAGLAEDAVARAAARVLRSEEIAAYARHVIEAAVAGRAAFQPTCTIDLPDLALAVHGTGPLVEAAMRNLATRPVAGGAEATRLDVFVAQPGLGGVPASAGLADPMPPSGVIADLLADAGLAGCVNGDLGVWYVLDPGRGIGVQLMATTDGFPAWELGAPFRLFLHWHYARHGRRLAHAGTLGCDGRGVLLAGAGGAGKSGTVAAGVLAGLTTVGDDYVLLAADGDDVTAEPLFRTLKQDAAGLARLGVTPPTGSRPNWQGKHELHIGDLTSMPMADRLAIGAILLPRVTGEQRTTIRPVARRDALLALSISAFAQLPGEMESGFRFFSALAQRLPCYRLDLGIDGREVAETILAFLARGDA